MISALIATGDRKAHINAIPAQDYLRGGAVIGVGGRSDEIQGNPKENLFIENNLETLVDSERRKVTWSSVRWVSAMPNLVYHVGMAKSATGSRWTSF